mmetsp:Transcript_56098/g.126785  ORF Transcript_56098/g.126785 Transcript_56098/m.126785 type:complete len:210 (+) Transcript_56098:21-650(+)
MVLRSQYIFFLRYVPQVSSQSQVGGWFGTGGCSLGMRCLEVGPHLHIPLHLHPHGEAGDHDAKEVTKLAPSDPPVGDKHEVAELPEGVKEVGEPTLGHDRASIIVAAGPVVDTPNGGDAASTMLLARVAETLNDLLVLGWIGHALPNVLSGFLRRLRRLELVFAEARRVLGRNLPIAEGLLLNRRGHSKWHISAANRKARAREAEHRTL